MSRELKPCGTPAAYKRHVRHGEEPCGACREAERIYRGCGVRPPLQPCGTPAAYARHLKAREPACEPCLRAHAARVRETKSQTRAKAASD